MWAVLFTLVTASAAYAGPKVMVSAPANSGYPAPQTLWCDILNADKKPQDVTIEIMDYSGTVVAGPFGPTTLPPMTGTAFGGFLGTGTWCKFTVNTSVKKFRAVAIYDNGTAYTVAVPAISRSAGLSLEPATT